MLNFRKNNISIRDIFIFITLLTFILPLIGISFLRIHESILIRQTENSIFAQGTSVAAMYKNLFLQYTGMKTKNELNHYLEQKFKLPIRKNPEKWSPWQASLDLLKDDIKDINQSITVQSEKLDPIAKIIGAQLTSIIKEIQLSTLAGIRVLDTKANIVASNGKLFDRRFKRREEIESALSGKAMSVLRNKIAFQPSFHLSSISRKNPLRVYYAQPVIFEQRVIAVIYVFRTPAPASKNLYQQRYLIFPLVLVLLIVGVVISLLASYTITKPIKLLVNQAQHIIRGDIEVLRPLAKPVTREVKLLSETLSEMAKIQNQRASYIKNFASHVSHEFKTPLSSIKAAAEILSDESVVRSKSEQKELHRLIENGSLRIQQLIEHLTKLSRADSTHINPKPVNILKIIEYSKMKYLSKFKSISLTNNLRSALVLMDIELMESIFFNLFENAWLHGGNQVEIILLNVEDDLDEQVEVIFSDNGCKINKHISSRIFDPFYTTKRQSGGTGLGLAIIKSLMVAHQGDIKLIETSAATKFRLTFKLPV